ncbi:MAG: NADH-quinone oxidoreductase subunit NuoE [Desulfobacterales bacterium]
MREDLPAEKAIGENIRVRVREFGQEKGNLIPILQMIQERHAYIPPEAMQIVAEHLQIPASEVYGVATFYNQFRFNPPGKHPVKVCLGTACHVKGGDIILENFERKLEISEGETSPDREFSLERVACVGCCALAPVGIVGDKVHGYMVPSKVEGLLLGIRMAKEKQQKKDSGNEADTSG